MNKQILIRLLAISTAASVVFGLSACNFGGQGEQTSATASTSMYTEPTTAETSETETEPDKSQVEFKGAKSIGVETTEKKKAYSSKNGDESALLINGEKKKVSIATPAVTKSGDSSNTTNSGLFGVNAAVLAMNSAKLYITGGSITTSGKGAAGLFAFAGFGKIEGITGDGTRVNISENTIATKGDDSPAIAATYGATLDMTKMAVTTDGKNSPAIIVGKDGGTVKITNGVYTTNGLHSPAVTTGRA